MSRFSPFDPTFLDSLEALASKGWSGVVWRAVSGDTDPLRANIRGGRWNPPGIEALYCSTSAEGAEAELRYHLDRQPVRPTRPIRVVELDVHLERVLDLTDPVLLGEAGIPLEQLAAEAWHLPHKIAEAVDWLRIAGLLVPSARHPARNLVILVNRLGSAESYDPRGP